MVIEVLFTQFLDKDVVCELQLLDVVAFDLAKHANTQPGTRERVSKHHFTRQPEFEADFAHFVLEQFAQWFDERHAHVFGQPREMPSTSLMIRNDTCSRNSYGSLAQRAVMKSMVSTARNAMTYS